MKFICPEIDSAERLEQNLFENSNQKKEYLNRNGTVHIPLFRYSIPNKGSDGYSYGTDSIADYFKFRPYNSTQRTITTLGTDTDTTIETNIDTSLTFEFRFHKFISDFKTNIFYVIFTDQGLYCVKPERLSTSQIISNFNLVSLFEKADFFDSVSFEGESGYNITLDIETNAIIPLTVDDTIRTYVVNKYKSQNGIAIIQTSFDANPLDYFNHDGHVYLVMSKKQIGNGYFEYVAVRESNETLTFTAADVTPVAITTSQNIYDGEESFMARNVLINGDFVVGQRSAATMTALATKYFGTCDRWVGQVGQTGGGGTATLTQTTSASCGESGYGLEINSITFAGVGSAYCVYQIVEAKNAKRLKNKTVSFRFKYYHNLSANTSVYMQIIKANVADTFSALSCPAWYTWYWAGGTAVAASGMQTATPSAEQTFTWENIDLGDVSGGFLILISFVDASAISGGTIQIADVQMNVGTTALEFKPRQYQTELALCQRYYQRRQGVAYQRFGQGQAVSTTDARVSIPLPVEMRATPTLYSGGTLSLIKADGTQQALTGSPTINTVGSNRQYVLLDVVAGAAVLAAGNATWLRAQNDTSAYIALDAEL